MLYIFRICRSWRVRKYKLKRCTFASWREKDKNRENWKKLQINFTPVSVDQFSSVRPFFHSEFNCLSIGIAFRPEKPKPAKIRISTGDANVRFFYLESLSDPKNWNRQKSGFLPGTQTYNFFTYFSWFYMVWEFQNRKACSSQAQKIRSGLGTPVIMTCLTISNHLTVLTPFHFSEQSTAL